MNIKIFCDIADVSLIKRFNKKKVVKGFTTNPSLMRKAGAKDYKSYSKQILKFCKNKPISFEVFADNEQSMIDQGKKINSWGKNVYVKVPVVNSKNIFTGNVIKELNNSNIKLNITAVYTAVIFNLIFLLLSSLITFPVNLFFELTTGTLTYIFLPQVFIFFPCTIIDF